MTQIKDDMFYYSIALNYLYIPKSIMSIEGMVFYSCSPSIILYEGTSEEWKNIPIGTDNACLSKDIIYYYTESQPTTEGNFWHYVDGVPTVW